MAILYNNMMYHIVTLTNLLAPPWLVVLLSSPSWPVRPDEVRQLQICRAPYNNNKIKYKYKNKNNYETNNNNHENSCHNNDNNSDNNNN